MSHANISAMLAEDRRRTLMTGAERARLARIPDPRGTSVSLAGLVMRLVRRRPQVTVLHVGDPECAMLQEVLR